MQVHIVMETSDRDEERAYPRQGFSQYDTAKMVADGVVMFAPEGSRQHAYVKTIEVFEGTFEEFVNQLSTNK